MGNMTNFFKRKTAYFITGAALICSTGCFPNYYDDCERFKDSLGNRTEVCLTFRDPSTRKKVSLSDNEKLKNKRDLLLEMTLSKKFIRGRVEDLIITSKGGYVQEVKIEGKTYSKKNPEDKGGIALYEGEYNYWINQINYIKQKRNNHKDDYIPPVIFVPTD